ncbi:MAG TPA: NAD(P)H-binding protein [Candidatus Limnocylindrales bacterium]|nr:NAD(P)H-binding protein [Candidatus Limnocylindrales bacterium]
MTIHRLSATQLVPRRIEEVFAFFERPENLGRITPETMGFEFLTEDREMREGLRIDYRIRPLLGIPLTWQTQIADYDPPNGFRDVQRRGPYRHWEHRHTFEAVEGGTLVRDDIEYALPLGPLGDVVNRLVVRSELATIFRHRAAAIRTVFAQPGPASGLTVAVAGGTGFVGAAIATELVRRGHRVVVLSHRGEPARGGLPDSVEIRSADVRTGHGLGEALAGVDAVAIALAFRNSPIEAPRRHQTFMEVDAGGTEHVVQAAVRAGVRRVVYLSGAGAAPDAARHWFRAKWRAEDAVRSSGMTWTIIRPTWIFGPRDVSLNRFIGFARRLGMVPMTNTGSQLLAPVFVDDAAVLAADALTADAAANQVFELGGPETLSMRRIIVTALRVAGLRRPIIPGPTPLIKLAALPLSWLPRPLLTPDAVDFINQPATVDIEPLLRRMPRRLTPLEEGLRTYLDAAGNGATLVFDGAGPGSRRDAPRPGDPRPPASDQT